MVEEIEVVVLMMQTVAEEPAALEAGPEDAGVEPAAPEEGDADGDELTMVVV